MDLASLVAKSFFRNSNKKLLDCWKIGSANLRIATSIKVKTRASREGSRCCQRGFKLPEGVGISSFRRGIFSRIVMGFKGKVETKS
jgi:hypothetical protein